MAEFNEACYLERYPDIRIKWKGDPYEHYLLYGQAEGRNPHCDPPGIVYSTEFNEACYLERYPDIRLEWPWGAQRHWEEFGRAEGRKPGCVIDPGNDVKEPADTNDTSDGATGSNKTLLWIGVGIAAIFLARKAKLF